MREKSSNKVVHVNGLRYGTKCHVLSFLHSFPLFRSLIQIMFIFFESLMTFDLRHWISFSNCKFVWCWILIKFGNTFYMYMHSPIMWASTLKNQLIIFHIHFHIFSSIELLKWLIKTFLEFYQWRKKWIITCFKPHLYMTIYPAIQLVIIHKRKEKNFKMIELFHFLLYFQGIINIDL